MAKEMILKWAKQALKKQGRTLSSSAKWFLPNEVEAVRAPDKTLGWMVGKDCETLRIVYLPAFDAVGVFSNEDVTFLAKEKTAA
jgi:hypothetical protein